MNKRIALLSLLLLPLMACTRQPPAASDAATDATPAPAADAAAETPAATETPAPAPADDSTAPAADADAATPADQAPPAAAAPVQGEPLVEGTDYAEIQNGQPFAPRNGQVEVVEVFGYVCPACAGFQPLVSAWKAKLPADVRFTYVPAMFGGVWENYGRAYYASESMGLVEKTHDALYKAIHIDHTLKGELGVDTPQDIAGFYAKFGANPQQFASTMESFTVAAKTAKAKQFAMRTGITGTPSLVIDGKYRVLGKTREDMLRIADQLIARERATP
jgi:thiol:disulfide interchange protein DsbA